MLSVSEVHGFELEWHNNGLIVEMWLESQTRSLLCRLLLDTGATHLGLKPYIIEELGLDLLQERASMTAVASGTSHDVSLYALPVVPIDTVRRYNLVVVPLDLPEVSGYHGVLGMNWLRTFAHVGLIHLQTDRPVLELHDPS
jgi:predicted aspartyl protease